MKHPSFNLALWDMPWSRPDIGQFCTELRIPPQYVEATTTQNPPIPAGEAQGTKGGLEK